MLTLAPSLLVGAPSMLGAGGGIASNVLIFNGLPILFNGVSILFTNS